MGLFVHLKSTGFIGYILVINVQTLVTEFQSKCAVFHCSVLWEVSAKGSRSSYFKPHTPSSTFQPLDNRSKAKTLPWLQYWRGADGEFWRGTAA